MQNLGSGDPHLTKLALDRDSKWQWGQPRVWNEVILKRWLNWDLNWLLRLCNKMIQSFSCVESHSIVNSEHTKQWDTSGHFRATFDYWTNESLSCCLSLQSWLALGFRALLDGQACCIEKILALKALCRISRVCVFLRWRSKPPYGSRWCNASSEQRAIINDWIYQFDIQLHKRADMMQDVDPFFSTKKQQNVCWQPKKSTCMILN